MVQPATPGSVPPSSLPLPFRSSNLRPLMLKIGVPPPPPGKEASPLAVPYRNETFEIWLTDVKVVGTVKWNTSAFCS
jgi:hypothetical protein